MKNKTNRSELKTREEENMEKVELLQAIKEGNLYDFISLNYNKYSKEELSSIIKELDYTLYNLMEYEKPRLEKINNNIAEELEERV